MKNYYATLEVPVGSDISAIRDAYRRLVQENLWNKEVFAELKDAYETLSTPARRMEYDQANFGQSFPVAGSDADTRLQATVGGGARLCPLDAGAQCPVLSARVPLQETFCPECGFLLAALPAGGFDAPAEALDAALLPRLEEPGGRVHRLRPGVNGVGREAADVLLTDKTVSRQHAQLEVAGDGRVFVEDLGSTNGTRVGEDVLAPNVRRPLADGSPVRFGSVSLVLRMPEAAPAPVELGAEPGGAEGEDEAAVAPESQAAPAPAPLARLFGTRGGVPVREDHLPPGVTTFGRRAENAVVLPGDPYVSGTHAQIIAEGGTFRLTDLGSTNGTLLNGARLAPNEPAPLQAGDEFAIGGLTYRFEPLLEPGTAETGTAETGTAETGTAETGTAETGTAETGTAETGTAETGTAETGMEEGAGAPEREAQA